MFHVLYHPSVVGDDLRGLSRDIKERLKAAVGNRLTSAPQDYGKPLRGQLHGLWSLRVGEHRVIYRIEKEQVKIIRIVQEGRLRGRHFGGSAAGVAVAGARF